MRDGISNESNAVSKMSLNIGISRRTTKSLSVDFFTTNHVSSITYGLIYVNTCPVRDLIQVRTLSDRLARYKFAYEAWHVYDSTFCVKIYENKLNIHDWH